MARRTEDFSFLWAHNRCIRLQKRQKNEVFISSIALFRVPSVFSFLVAVSGDQKATRIKNELMRCIFRRFIWSCTSAIFVCLHYGAVVPLAIPLPLITIFTAFHIWAACRHGNRVFWSAGRFSASTATVISAVFVT